MNRDQTSKAENIKKEKDNSLESSSGTSKFEENNSPPLLNDTQVSKDESELSIVDGKTHQPSTVSEEKEKGFFEDAPDEKSFLNVDQADECKESGSSTEPVDDQEPTSSFDTDIVPDDLTGQNCSEYESQSVRKAIEDLHKIFTDYLKNNAAFSREAFSAIKSELRAYKEDFLFEHERSLLIDLIMLSDEVIKIDAYYDSMSNDDLSNCDEINGQIMQDFQSILNKIYEILRRKGVERYECPDEKLKIKWQKATKKEFSADPNDDKKIIAVIKQGFERGGKPFRKEEVVIYRYREEKNRS